MVTEVKDLDVYADLLFLINFSMDFLCLYLSIKLLHLPRVRWRMLSAAALGGVYSVVALFVSVGAWLSLALDIGVCLGMCVLCSAGKGVRVGRVFLLFGTYFGVSALMGGGMTAIYSLLSKANFPLGDVQSDGISAWMFLVLAAAAALVAAFGGRLFSKQTAVRTCTVRISINGVTWEMVGLCDSGNLLCDPISGTPVIVADRQTWLSALPDALRRAVESEGRQSVSSSDGKRVRIVPMHTAQSSGMAVALLPDEILLTEPSGKTRAVHALIAPSGEPLQGEYRAVVPATLLQ
jgi:stage II sporulation protein GA (sporulation sigma-E factor processing peptidase)